MGAFLLILAIAYIVYRLMTRKGQELPVELSSGGEDDDLETEASRHSEFVAPGFISKSGNLNTSDDYRLM
ncbi:hypothetical protein LMG22037_06156 [Paraburkholderia phenoliruptrix]|jgi:hypothetical protein|uniref:Uncharacterized protein n=1 Tax=Paraburkholderia phenoliruptrix TaxID=252970 RepID=A0A6J5CHS2_9BURK|nr:hypothetical protein [Paraburkholderia phenoliruptrix]CAB3737540.1 hypothetical protein LMG22037_06156 [Paraburkholderia phenoliruptrix]